MGSNRVGADISSLDQGDVSDLQSGAKRCTPPVLTEERLDSRFGKNLSKRHHILAAAWSRSVHLHAPLQYESEVLN